MHSTEYIADFGMDTISLAGPLAAKLRAIKDAGFGQVMFAARDLVGHPDGWQAAVQEVRDSGLRVTGFQVLRWAGLKLVTMSRYSTPPPLPLHDQPMLPMPAVWVLAMMVSSSGLPSEWLSPNSHTHSARLRLVNEST